jgi:uncharacterized protein with ParB-like and HNH nuclease domain
MSTSEKKNRYGIDLHRPEIDGEESLDPGSSEMIQEIVDIKKERAQFSIFELKRRFDRRKSETALGKTYSDIDLKNQIILDSAFQRGEVWNRRQQSELIESVLLGLPLPLMYFYEDKNANLIVVDGRQRLTAFFKYMDNKFSLTELKIMKGIAGKKFKELDPVLQSKLEDFQLIVEIIKPPTPDTVRFQIFDRVNRGGTPLNNQEMRNALYQGNASELLKQLAESEEFRVATDNGVNPKRMKDRYIILRAVAFYLLRCDILRDEQNKRIEYRAIDDFLGKTMEFLNAQGEDFLQKLERKMLNAFQLSFQVLGGEAFRLTKENKRKSPINMNVFEVWIYLMTLLDGREVSLDILGKEYVKLIANPEFLNSIGNHRDNPTKVDSRFVLVEAIFQEVVADD